jgi:hypothetical protein
MNSGAHESNLSYFRRLVEAGLEGLVSAGEGSRDAAFNPALTPAVWAPTAIGAAIGTLSAVMGRDRRSGSSIMARALVGSVFGFGGGMAFASRGVIRTAARSSARKVNAVRDARWLEKNPIAYA